MNLNEKINKLLAELGRERKNSNEKVSTAARIKNHYLTLLFNLFPDVDPFFDLRNKIMGFGYAGENVRIRSGFKCSNPGNIYFLDNSFLNYNCTILAKSPVVIGKSAAIGPNVGIYTVEHLLDEEQGRFRTTSLPIIIEDLSWIGAGASILSGVTIGTKSVIGAGAVVTKDVERGWLYAGVPAIKIKKVN